MLSDQSSAGNRPNFSDFFFKYDIQGHKNKMFGFSSTKVFSYEDSSGSQ